MADPVSRFDRHPGLQRSGESIAEVVASLRAAGAVARDHRRRRRVERRHRRRAPARPAPRSCGTRTTRATAPRSRAASARATGEYVLIVDGDGQHPPRGRAAARGAARRVRPRRSARARRATQATQARRVGNGALNWLAELPDRTRDSRPHLRLPRRARRETCASSSTCCPTGSRRRRRRRWRSSRRATTSTFEPIDARQRVGQSKIRLARDGVQVPADHPSRSSRSSARCASSCRSALASFALGVGYARLDDRHAVARHQLVGPADHARGRSCSSSGWCRSRSPRCASKGASSAMPLDDCDARAGSSWRPWSAGACCGSPSPALLDRQAADARRARVPGARAQPRGRARASSTTPTARGRHRAAVRPRAGLSAVPRGHRRWPAPVPRRRRCAVKLAQALVGARRRLVDRRRSRGAPEARAPASRPRHRRRLSRRWCAMPAYVAQRDALFAPGAGAARWLLQVGLIGRRRRIARRPSDARLPAARSRALAALDPAGDALLPAARGGLAGRDGAGTGCIAFCRWRRPASSLPWTIRNIRVYGRFVLVASEGGVTFWTGNHPLAVGDGDLAANPAIKRAELEFRRRTRA